MRQFAGNRKSYKSGTTTNFLIEQKLIDVYNEFTSLIHNAFCQLKILCFIYIKWNYSLLKLIEARNTLIVFKIKYYTAPLLHI